MGSFSKICTILEFLYAPRSDCSVQHAQMNIQDQGKVLAKQVSGFGRTTFPTCVCAACVNWNRRPDLQAFHWLRKFKKAGSVKKMTESAVRWTDVRRFYFSLLVPEVWKPRSDRNCLHVIVIEVTILNKALCRFYHFQTIFFRPYSQVDSGSQRGE